MGEVDLDHLSLRARHGDPARLVPLRRGGTLLPPSRARQVFPEFNEAPATDYAREMQELVSDWPTRQPRACRRVTRGVGVGLGTHRPDHLRHRRRSAGHCATRGGREERGATLRLPAPVRRAGECDLLWNEYYATEEEFVFAVADVLHEEYKGIVDVGLPPPGRRRRLAARYDSILSLGGSTLTTAAAGQSFGSEALNHVLRRWGSRRIVSATDAALEAWHGPYAFYPPLVDVIDLRASRLTRTATVRAGERPVTSTSVAWGRTSRFSREGGSSRPSSTHHQRRRASELVAERLVRLAEAVGRESVMAVPTAGRAGRRPAAAPDDSMGEARRALAQGAHLGHEAALPGQRGADDGLCCPVAGLIGWVVLSTTVCSSASAGRTRAWTWVFRLMRARSSVSSGRTVPARRPSSTRSRVRPLAGRVELDGRDLAGLLRRTRGAWRGLAETCRGTELFDSDLSVCKRPHRRGSAPRFCSSPPEPAGRRLGARRRRESTCSSLPPRSPDPIAEAMPTELTEGQRSRRVARAIAMEPRLLPGRAAAGL